jgi:hypothetical protein
MAKGEFLGVKSLQSAVQHLDRFSLRQSSKLGYWESTFLIWLRICVVAPALSVEIAVPAISRQLTPLPDGEHQNPQSTLAYQYTQAEKRRISPLFSFKHFVLNIDIEATANVRGKPADAGHSSRSTCESLDAWNDIR